MRIYGEITKLEPQDDGTLKVVGIASSGAVDSAEERVDPAAMKAALPDYMRFGALREMHGMTAAGATLAADVDGEGFTRIEAHVVDPVAIRKVKLGVYKGFSIGGRVTARDKGDPKRITGLKLDEISLVDRPCNPEAVIQMWKLDAPAPDAPTNAEVLAKARELAAAAGRRGRHADYVVKARQLLVDAAEAEADTQALAALQAADLAKIGARNSAADQARIQAAHDELVALGAQCQDENCGLQDEDQDDDPDSGLEDEDEAPDPADDPPAGKALRAGPLSGDLSAQVDRLTRTVLTLHKRLEDLAAEPRAPKAVAGWARAVTKAEDVRATPPGPSPEEVRKYLDSLPQEERGRLELRAALSRPMAIGF